MSREFGSRLVYVIGVDENPVKIGIADRIQHRLSGLQVGCPDELRVFHVAKVPHPLAALIERDAHATLADHHRRGEWFNIHRDDAIRTVEALKAKHLADYRRDGWDSGWDLISRLSSVFEIRNGARGAVVEYQTRLEAGDGYAGHANGYILTHAGEAAYAVFSIVIAQQKGIDGLRYEDRLKAEAALARAVNTLCDFSEQHRTLQTHRRMARGRREA